MCAGGVSAPTTSSSVRDRSAWAQHVSASTRRSANDNDTLRMARSSRQESVPARLSGSEERMGFRLLVQRFGRQVDAARPDDRPGLRINRDLSEVGGVIQWRQDARPPFTGEIDIPGSAVAEQQAQHAVTDHGDTRHGWQVALIHDLHVTPAGRCRAGADSAVPVPSSPGSHRA
jgi:hypothetical protein